VRYEEFEQHAAEFFGIEPGGEARDFAETLEAAGLDYTEVSGRDRDFWEIASELTDEYYEDVELPEPEERYPLDPYWPDDDYLDPYEEWEITVTYKEV
jgi:hypothetical protein